MMNQISSATTPRREKETAGFDDKVKSHLKRMGFTW